MKKLLVNILWIIIATPFYVLIGACFLYSMLIIKTFNHLNDEVGPYNWVDIIDEWFFNLKDKWL